MKDVKNGARRGSEFARIVTIEAGRSSSPTRPCHTVPVREYTSTAKMRAVCEEEEVSGVESDTD